MAWKLALLPLGTSAGRPSSQHCLTLALQDYTLPPTLPIPCTLQGGRAHSSPVFRMPPLELRPLMPSLPRRPERLRAGCMSPAVPVLLKGSLELLEPGSMTWGAPK